MNKGFPDKSVDPLVERLLDHLKGDRVYPIPLPPFPAGPLARPPRQILEPQFQNISKLRTLTHFFIQAMQNPRTPRGGVVALVPQGSPEQILVP